MVYLYKPINFCFVEFVDGWPVIELFGVWGIELFDVWGWRTIELFDVWE